MTLAHAFIVPENVESLLDGADTPAEPDLLSLDIDGNDYHVLAAIQSRRPRVLVLEYNAQFGAEGNYVMPFDPAHGWSGHMAFGAALAPLAALCERKGYALVGCNISGVNAFFVRQDLLGDRFTGPFTAARHWRPPLHPVGVLSARFGHRMPKASDLSAVAPPDA